MHVSWLLPLMCPQLLAALHIVLFKSITETLRWPPLAVEQELNYLVLSVAANSCSTQGSKCFMFCFVLRFILSDLRPILKEQSEGFKYNINCV